MTDASNSPTISIRNVSKSFGKGIYAIRVLDDVSLDIGKREFFTLLGPSGCGKTTLLRLIAGFETTDAGTIAIEGRDVTAAPPFHRPVNTVFQSYALFPHLTVEQNVAFALEEQRVGRDAIRTRVGEVLEMVRMNAFGGRRPAELSGGQQQRVALARALAPRPRVLLLDEPLSALDLKLRKEMQIELKRLQTETGITFVFVTHDQEEALTMSDRIAVMSSGNILQVGSPREIYDTPANRFVADFIGETNFLKGKISAIESGTASLALPAGATLTAPSPDNAKSGDEITVMVRPEHARLASPARGEQAILSGALANIIYLGTDTYFNVKLADGEVFTVRQQNRPGEEGSQAVGDAAGITFPPGAIRVLRT